MLPGEIRNMIGCGKGTWEQPDLQSTLPARLSQTNTPPTAAREGPSRTQCAQGAGAVSQLHTRLSGISHSLSGPLGFAFPIHLQVVDFYYFRPPISTKFHFDLDISSHSR